MKVINNRTKEPTSTDWVNKKEIENEHSEIKKKRERNEKK